MKPSVYNHGLPFNQKLAENLDDIYNRVKKDRKGAIVVIDGGVGEGKTTLAVHCVDYINSLEGLPLCDLDSQTCVQIAMGGSDFVTKLGQCFKLQLPVVVYDEAGDFNRRGALTAFNAMLNRVFDTFRTYQVIVIIVLPNFRILEEELYDKALPRGLLHCFGKKQGNYGNFSAYDHIRMQWIKWMMSKMRVKQQAYGMEASNFDGQFLDLSPERGKQLDVLSTKGKLEVLETIQIKMDGLLSYEELSIKLQKPVRWLRDVVKRCEIKPVKRHNTKVYFSPDVVDAFVDYMNAVKPGRKKESEV